MDISLFRDRECASTMSVGEINNFIKSIFDSNRSLQSVTVKGEISNFKRHSSGHLYFSLKDSESQIKCVMFRSRADYLKFQIDNGMKVIIHGSVSVYSRDGSYQLYASSMQPDGIGALYLAYEQLKAKLDEEGLFDESHKKLIPRYPERIGVITSPTGAAVRDIINVISRRYPLAEIYLYPALVQGDGAENTLIDGINYFEASRLVDTVIIGRGGGSIEDLWAFNSERLARCIYSAKTPIISAVGHETDFTICDFVSDLRAPTPSAAAEIATPDIRSLLQTLDGYTDKISSSLLRSVEIRRERLSRITEKEFIKNPESLIGDYNEKLQVAKEELVDAFSSLIKENTHKVSNLLTSLNALNPLSVLERGFSVTFANGKAVRGKNDLLVGEEIEIRLVDGSAKATVNEIK